MITHEGMLLLIEQKPPEAPLPPALYLVMEASSTEGTFAVELASPPSSVHWTKRWPTVAVEEIPGARVIDPVDLVRMLVENDQRAS